MPHPVGMGRAPLQPGTCKSPDFFSPEMREKKILLQQ